MKESGAEGLGWEGWGIRVGGSGAEGVRGRWVREVVSAHVYEI